MLTAYHLAGAALALFAAAVCAPSLVDRWMQRRDHKRDLFDTHGTTERGAS